MKQTRELTKSHDLLGKSNVLEDCGDESSYHYASSYLR